MARPDFARRYTDLSKQEDAEMDSYLLEGYKSAIEIGQHQTMVDNRKKYDWQNVVTDATKYLEDASQPLRDRIDELEALVKIRPEHGGEPEDFLTLHNHVIELLGEDANKDKGKELTEKVLIPLGLRLLQK